MTLSLFKYIRSLWAEFLRVPVESVEHGSNHFQLGGYSLLAFEVWARIKERSVTGGIAPSTTRWAVKS